MTWMSIKAVAASVSACATELQPTEIDFKREQVNAYTYVGVNFPDSLNWTFGLSDHRFEEDDLELDKFNPKVGLDWQINRRIKARAAVFKTLKRTLVVEQTIEPTQIMGFNQFFDDFNGTELWRYAGAFDVQFGDDLSGGVEVSYRELDLPLTLLTLDGGTRSLVEGQDETIVRSYLYWSPFDRWAVTGGFVYDRFEADLIDTELPQEVNTQAIPASVRYFHPSGVFAVAGVTLTHQDVERDFTSDEGSGNDEFVLIDLSIGYRVPRRRGVISVEMNNVLDEGFQYEDDNFRQSRNRRSGFARDRSIFGRVTLIF